LSVPPESEAVIVVAVFAVIRPVEPSVRLTSFQPGEAVRRPRRVRVGQDPGVAGAVVAVAQDVVARDARQGQRLDLSVRVVLIWRIAAA
jgi:hypothetical protein